MPGALAAPADVAKIETRVGTIAVRRTPTRGAGPHEPAILVHGLGGNSLNWVDLADELSDRLDCVAVDLPGFGATEPLDSHLYTMAAHADAVIATMEAVFPGQTVHLFGNSMGGAISVQLAGRHPELVRTLTLISPALPDYRPRSTNIQVPVMAVPRLGPRLFDRFQRVGPARRVQATFELCFADPRRVPPQRRAEAEAEAIRRDALPYIGEAFTGSTQGLIATFLDRGPDRPWALTRRITAPTLLVYGRKDKLVNARAAHRATASFPNARVVVIPDCGHVAMMEHPEQVQRWWRELLDR